MISLLGMVRFVDAHGVDVELRSPNQRRLLCALALAGGDTIRGDYLGEILGMAPSALRTAVSRLRSLVGDDVIITDGPGYYVRSDIDSQQFEDVATTTTSRGDERLTDLDDALALWHGPAVDEFSHEPWAQGDAARLDELRVIAVEDRAELMIAVDRSDEAVAVLTAHVSVHPHRDRPWGLLMQALSVEGRQADALRSYQQYRSLLVDETGTDPSPAVQAIEQRIIGGDTDERQEIINTLVTSDLWPHDTDSASSPAATEPGSLPRPLSSFVGRLDEIGEIAQFLKRARLVTLRGLGGMGKTSLALRIAADQAAEFDDGVWFIDLAYVAPAAEISERFLAAIGLSSGSDVAPLDRLLTQLKPLRALLVVDNCEQRINEIAEIVERIVQIAPNVHVLATSRASLAIVGEAVWQVEPLEVPAAIELFTERARLLRQDFEVSDTNRRVVELICRKLDGIPLAIELAAARLNVLSLDQILEHLDDRFRLLSGPALVQGNEERTLRSALDWSYALLDEQERRLLRCLAVFPVGFTLEAAKEICAEGAGVVGLMNSMALLVEASLVVFDANHTDPRYRLLETVREYVVEIRSEPERDEIAVKHVRYYVGLASQIAVQHETDHTGALQAGDRDLDNFRAAMAYTYAHEYPELGLSIARHLRTYFFARQLNREFLRWLQAGLEQADPESDEALLAIANALVAAINSEEIVVADQLAERVKDSIDLARSAAVRARLLASSAVHLIETDPRAADKLLAAATELAKHMDSTTTLACIHNRVIIAWRTGDLPDAEAMIGDLNDLPDGPLVRRERVLLEIQTAACAGKWEEVIDASLEHYGLDEEASSDLLSFRAEALGALTRTDEAIATLDRLDGLERREDLARTGSQILRAITELRRGDAATAKSLFAETAASYSRESERVHGFWIASLAGAAAHQLGEDDAAAVLFGYARTIGDDFDIHLRMSERPLAEHASQQCRAKLGPNRFDELTNLGSSSNWPDLVELLHTTG